MASISTHKGTNVKSYYLWYVYFLTFILMNWFSIPVDCAWTSILQRVQNYWASTPKAAANREFPREMIQYWALARLSGHRQKRVWQLGNKLRGSLPVWPVCGGEPISGGAELRAPPTRARYTCIHRWNLFTCILHREVTFKQYKLTIPTFGATQWIIRTVFRNSVADPVAQ